MSLFATPRQRAGTLIGVLGLAILLAVGPFLMGLLGVAVLHVICSPLYRRLSTRLSGRIAALLIVLGAALLLLLPGAALVGVVIDQAGDTVKSMSGTTAFARIAAIRIGTFDVGAQITRAGGTMLSWLSGQAFQFFGSATRATLNLVLALFGLYYMLQEADPLWERFRAVLPFSDPAREALKDRFYSVTRATLLGTVLTAFLQGSIVGIGFALVGLPNAAFWGVITACVSVLPVLGSALVWLPGVVILLANDRYAAATGLALLGGIVASNVDNVVRPFVFKRVSHIHPMVSLVGAFAGVNLFGLIGLLVGPLAITYFFELLRLFREDYGADAPAAA
jgi:predicted PurR-regulated permease PerM